VVYVFVVILLSLCSVHLSEMLTVWHYFSAHASLKSHTAAHCVCSWSGDGGGPHRLSECV